MPSRIVKNFPVNPNVVTTINVPAESFKPLCVECEGDTVFLCAEVGTNAINMTEMKLVIVRYKETVPENGVYVGTALNNGELQHIYEVV